MNLSPRKLAPRWGRRAVVLCSATAVTAGAAAAPPAQAAFTTMPCLGQAVVGRGASFQKSAQDAFKVGFENTYCPGISGSNPGYTYESRGSGAGRRVMGERTNGLTANPPDLDNTNGENSRAQVPRYGATDEAPKTNQEEEIEKGRDAVGDEGVLHTIPIAAGPIALLVNFPDNCDVKSLPDANETNPAATNFTDRVRFTQAQLEQIWFGDSASDQWGDIFPTLTGIAPKTDPECRTQPIKRAVRFDDSGTTFAFKDYLRAINPGRGWLTTYLSNPDSRHWPNTPTSAATPGTNPTINGGANGNSFVADAVNANDGSIGYADLAIARSKGFQDTAQTAGPETDDKYWTQVQNGSGTFTEPTADAQSFLNGIKGGLCASTVYQNVPGGADPTLGNWFNTTGVNAAAGYGICTLTYALAFDDNATAYGNNATEEAKARTVKDFLTYVLTDAGQATLFPGDYGPVPTAGGQSSILEVARRGTAAIGFNKAGDAGGGTGGGGGGGNTNTNTNTQSPVTNTIAAKLAISNLFSISSIAVGRNGSLVATLRVPGAGRVRGLATAKIANKRAKKGKKPTKGKKEKTRQITVGSTTVNPTQGGSIRVPIRLTKVAAAALKSRRKLSVSIAFTYTPSGGQARTLKRGVNLKAAKKKKSSQ